jgi:Ca2+-binding RTX toxin-like protein
MKDRRNVDNSRLFGEHRGKSGARGFALGIRKITGQLVVAAALLLAGTSPAEAATITVNDTGDSVADAGSCVLREAIVSANTDLASGTNPGECAAGAGADVIAFSFAGSGPHTITPATQYPALTGPTIVDGSTEPDEIILDGTLTTFDVALWLDGNDSSVVGLSLVRWGYGVYITGDRNRAANNRIGTNQSDGTGLGTTVAGVLVEEGQDSVIEDNVIAGSAQQGIRVAGGLVQDLKIQGNLIGTNSTGTAAIPNAEGISIRDADGTLVGGSPAESNLISGNGGPGVQVTGSATDSNNGSVISNNRIGTNLAGTAALPNLLGVSIRGDSRSTAIEQNLISGNSDTGVHFEDTVGVPNTPSGATVTGNRIGLNAAGTAILANGRGVNFVDVANPIGPGNVVGGVTGLTAGSCTGDCNVIAGSTINPGVVVGSNSDHVAILGNQIRDNFGLGIDLAALPSGVTPNDPGDGDTGPNGLQNYPVIDAALAVGGNLLLTGSLDSTPAEDFRIEIFGSQTPDPSGLGEGESYLGGFGVETPAGDSTVPFSRVLATPFTGGSTLSGTATRLDPVANRPVTSEFGPQSGEGCDQSGSGSGEELIAGDDGEVLCGSGGDDNLKSGDAGDILSGGTGSDTADFSDLTGSVGASLALDQAIHGSIDMLLSIENLTGSPQADVLAGSPDSNLLRGGESADQINPGAGVDTVFGGGGGDSIVVDDGVADALVNCGPGSDTVTADPSLVEPASLFIDCETIVRPLEPEPTCDTDPSLCPPTCETDQSLCPPEPVVYKCDGIKATIVGTNNSETINGTNGRDVIVARAGKDEINPKKGNDLICAGDGVDTVTGSGGNDRALGQDGADILKGGDGNDKLLGGAKDDKLYGHNHGDILKGGEGSDRLEGGANADTLYGEGHGKDKLYGNSGFDKLNGGDGGNDFCDGGTDNDRRKAAGCEKRKRLP